MRPERARKRDGRIVPFDSRKIAAAIGKAFAATGEGDGTLAAELAEVVTLALSRRRGTAPGESGAIPSIEEIQDLVERVLMETGYAKTAKAYILYRDKRARVRELLSVRDNESVPGKSLRVEASRGGSESWSKGRIVAALMQEADLPRETAEAVASRVEQKVFASGLRRLSTTLIRELVDNELFEMGLEGKRRLQTLIGIPKYDLGQLLRTGFLEREGFLQGAAQDPVAFAARELVERYALEELLGDEAAELHREGDLHFARLSQIDREFSVAVRSEELRFGGLALAKGALRSAQNPEVWRNPVEAAQGISRLAAELLRGASSQVLLEGIEDWLGFVEDPRVFAKALRERIDLLRGPTNEIQVSLPPGVAVEPGMPTVVATLSYDAIRIGPGISRGVGERTPVLACGALLSINCPRQAYRGGPWQDAKLLDGLVATVERGVAGLAAIAEFQKQARAVRRLALPLGRISYAVSLEGVVEAVRFLREGAYDPDLARTIRTAVADLLRDLSLRRNVALSLEEFSQRESASRFARLDYDRFPGARGVLAQENPIYHNQFAASEAVS